MKGEAWSIKDGEGVMYRLKTGRDSAFENMGKIRIRMMGKREEIKEKRKTQKGKEERG